MNNDSVSLFRMRAIAPAAIINLLVDILQAWLNPRIRLTDR